MTKKKTKRGKSKKSTRKKQSKKKDDKTDLKFVLIPAFIIVALILGVVAIKFFYKPEAELQQIEYNGFIFTNQSNVWLTQIQINNQLYNLMFKYPPAEVEDIKINYLPNNFTKLTQQHNHIYITFDPEDENLGYIAVSAADLSRALRRVYGLTPIPACTKNVTSGCAKAAIQTCNTTERPVIYIDNNPVQDITYKGNCLIIQGEKEDLTKAVEKVILNWYKIIPDAEV